MSNTDKICPVCDEGRLHGQLRSNPVEYKGKTANLDMQFSVCDLCGSEQASSEELRANKRAMMAFKKQVDGLLTGSEVRHLRERLGITQSEAAHLFGGGPVAFSKYESDDVMQSEAMDKLLRVAIAVPGVIEYLAGGVDIHYDVDLLNYPIEMNWIETVTSHRSFGEVIGEDDAYVVEMNFDEWSQPVPAYKSKNAA